VRLFALWRKVAQAPRVERAFRARFGEHVLFASRIGPGKPAGNRDRRSARLKPTSRDPPQRPSLATAASQPHYPQSAIR
jgi:hypothetical protein